MSIIGTHEFPFYYTALCDSVTYRGSLVRNVIDVESISTPVMVLIGDWHSLQTPESCLSCFCRLLTCSWLDEVAKVISRINT